MELSKIPSNPDFLERLKRELGIQLLGIADITEERKLFRHLPTKLLDKTSFAIVIGERVSPTVLGTLEDRPNLIYFHHYRQLNFQLDRAAQRIASEIDNLGHHALAIAASQIVDWGEYAGHVSHKKLAWLAGLGWRGRNSLLVTPQCGAQVRLASVLTDLSLSPASPLDKNCGHCQQCLTVCPAKAIKEKAGNFDRQACFDKLKEFSRIQGIGQHICGLCVKACPGLGK